MPKLTQFCQGVVTTEVLVCSTTKEPVKLVFAATGTYLFKAERMKYADVPALVSAAVTANYSTYTIMKRAEKIYIGRCKYPIQSVYAFDKCSARGYFQTQMEL